MNYSIVRLTINILSELFRFIVYLIFSISNKDMWFTSVELGENSYLRNVSCVTFNESSKLEYVQYLFCSLFFCRLLKYVYNIWKKDSILKIEQINSISEQLTVLNTNKIITVFSYANSCNIFKLNEIKIINFWKIIYISIRFSSMFVDTILLSLMTTEKEYCDGYIIETPKMYLYIGGVVFGAQVILRMMSVFPNFGNDESVPCTNFMVIFMVVACYTPIIMYLYSLVSDVLFTLQIPSFNKPLIDAVKILSLTDSLSMLYSSFEL